MPTASVQVGYRPIRIGFLVREGSVDDVVEAARLNTLIWGGVRNPIIPVGVDIDAASRLIDAFRLDVLYRVGDDEASSEVVKRHPMLNWPRMMGDQPPFDQVGDGELRVVDMRLIVSHHWESGLRHGGESRVAWPNWSLHDALASLYSVMFGEFGDSPPAPRYRSAYQRGLRAEEVVIGEHVPPELLDRVTPVVLTGDQLRMARRWPDAHGLVIGDPDRAEHLAGYWNLRSVGLNVAFWPLSASNALKDYCVGHLQRVSAPPAQDSPGRVTYFWHFGNEHRDVVDELRVELPEGTEIAIADLDDAIWQGPSLRPGVWKSLPKTVLANVEPRWGRQSMVFALPERPFSSSQVDLLHPFWVVTVSAASEFQYPGYTLRLPSLEDLNEWASYEMGHGLTDVRLLDADVGFLVDYRTDTLDFSLVEEEAVVRQLFKRGNLTAEVSQAGEATKRIMRQMGGLLRCRVFRLPGVRKLLATTPRSHKWRDAMRIIIDEGSLMKYSNIESPKSILRRLLDSRVLQAGLRVQCPECRIRSRYQPEALEADIKCPSCGSAFALAPLLEDSHWEYQGSGFFAHQGQHGAIPVILTLLRLESDLSGHSVFLTPSHLLKGDGIDCESDLLFLYVAHDGDVAVGIAECKGHDEVTQQDLDNLTAVSDRVRATGVECFLVFATTRDSFTSDEISRFQDYRKRIDGQFSLLDRFQGWPRPAPMLFTERDLGTYDPGLHDDLQLPHPHPMTPNEIAANSAHLYLDGNLPALDAGEERLI